VMRVGVMRVGVMRVGVMRVGVMRVGVMRVGVVRGSWCVVVALRAIVCGVVRCKKGKEGRGYLPGMLSYNSSKK